MCCLRIVILILTKLIDRKNVFLIDRRCQFYIRKGKSFMKEGEHKDYTTKTLRKS